MGKNFRHSAAFKREAREVGARETASANLFFPFPRQWGLRGDKYLWATLAAHFSDRHDVPDFEQDVRSAFAMMTGHDFDTAPGEFQVHRFEYGGMSSGGICMHWWRNTGLPLLLHRLETFRSH